MKRKFIVGDRVSFDWNGRNGTGKIVETETGFLDNSILVQLEGELRGEGHDGNGNSKRTYATNDYYFFNPTSLTLIPEESIHITREDDTVHAVLKNGKNVVKRSKAVCSPDDEFDFETGAKLAMSRLFKESKEDSFPYVVLEGYILPEIMVPYLEDESGHFYGLLGTPTKMKDLRGEPLFVGDIVELYDSSWRNRGDSIIVDDHGDKFVQGIRMQCKNSGDIDHDFIVIKKQSYKDLEKGEVYRSVHRVDPKEK